MHLSVGSTYLAPQLFHQKIWDGVACAHLVMLAAGAVCVVCVRKEGKEEGAVRLVMMMMMLLAWRGWHDFAWLPRYQLSDAGYIAARYERACVCACVWALCGGRVTGACVEAPCSPRRSRLFYLASDDKENCSSSR